MTPAARTLVTGARGALGRQIVDALAKGGEHVFGISRSRMSESEGAKSRVVWLRCDLLNANDLRSAVRQTAPSMVVHAAGLAGTADLKALVEANVVALSNLLDALAETRVERIVVIGSAAEYASVDSTEPIREEHSLAPSNNYGLSKLFEFEVSQLAGRRGMPVIYARPFNVIGPDSPPATAVGDISRRLARLVVERRSDPLEVGDLDKWRDYIDVRDVAAGCVTLLRHGEPRHVYNVCSGVPVELSQLVSRLIAIAGIPRTLRRVDRGQSIGFQVGDPSALRALGWSARYDLDTSLRDGFVSSLRELGAS